MSQYGLMHKEMRKEGRDRCKDLFLNLQRITVSSCSTMDVRRMIGVMYAGYRLAVVMMSPVPIYLG